MSSVISFSGAKPSSFEPLGARATSALNSSPNSWGSLEQAINQVVNPVAHPTLVETRPQIGFAIGENKQTFMMFGPRIEKQIEQVQNVLHQITTAPTVEKEPDQVQASKVNKVSTEQVIEGTYEHVEKAGKATYKQGKDIFGALGDLFFGEIGFKYLSPEQKKKQQEDQEKLRAQNENKRSFFGALSNARVVWENMVMKMLNELQERMGIGGKSLEEKNKLLGMKGRNFSYTGVNTPYHIKAMHDALIEQANQQKLQQSKTATVLAGKKKTNYFMDKNSALSRQGQSVYSAAG